ncbi:hypothetical protein LKO27_13605 [Tessaracoccus sp. OS52]|uniref:hypothetical protein n=1 Tax=Tessaracoccus sp. OS52 TaxID=2886691 RepID=UPI001D112E52|nr:hypothetical protein [Tessaracoccus sp. OS52]MCC2594440.1 hypothetical protein [Tessaracoccus sp. OS52]
MKNFERVLRVLFAAGAVLQVVLAIAVVSRSWWIALLFLAAAALLGRGALRGCRRNLKLGSALALIVPLLVGLTGVEPFELAHHVVRLGVVSGMLVTWLLVRSSVSAKSPAQQA